MFFFAVIAQLVERWLAMSKVAGSRPVYCTICSRRIVVSTTDFLSVNKGSTPFGNTMSLVLTTTDLSEFQFRKLHPDQMEVSGTKSNCFSTCRFIFRSVGLLDEDTPLSRERGRV